MFLLSTMGFITIKPPFGEYFFIFSNHPTSKSKNLKPGEFRRLLKYQDFFPKKMIFYTTDMRPGSGKNFWDGGRPDQPFFGAFFVWGQKMMFQGKTSNGERSFWKILQWGMPMGKVFFCGKNFMHIFAHPLFLRSPPYRVLKWGKHPADVVKNSHPKHVVEKWSKMETKRNFWIPWKC